MTNTAHLYRLTSPSGKMYIGIAKNVRTRWQDHASAARRGSECTLHKAIRKYGFDNFKKEILLTSTFSYVKEMEVKAIAAFNCFKPHGYNLTKGGDGTLGFKHSEESKRLRSEKLKGRAFAEERKLKISSALKGRTLPDDQKQKISATLKATPRKPEWGKNISKAKKGVPQTEEARKIRAESQKLKWADPEYKTRQLELQRLGLQRKRERIKSDAA